MKEYDIAIVGGGPSGLFAAHELVERFGKTKSIVLFDKGDQIDDRTCLSNSNSGSSCGNCDPCGITNGIMGAGLKSDGKLHFHKEVMETHRQGMISAEETDNLLTHIEGLFERWGLQGPVYPIHSDTVAQMSRDVESLGLGDSFELKVKQRTRHIGSDRLPFLVSNMIEEITTKGDVSFQVRSNLVGYDHPDGKSFLTIKRNGGVETIQADKVFIGLGRRGSMQVQELIHEFSIPYSYRPVEIGGRIELPSEIMESVTNEVYNPCFRQKNASGFATFTFCTNPNGYLTTESLLPNIIGVNGESKKNQKSQHTNFAVLTELPIPPGDNPNDTLVHLLKDTFTAKVPLVQTTADFVDGVVRDEKIRPQSTLRNLEYANIAGIFPETVTTEIRNFLCRLNEIYPGVVSHKTLFIAPEAKIRGMRVTPRNESLETNIDGLYLIGDSSGLSANIVAAALTGVLAAKTVYTPTPVFDLP